jgi:hypothetical protein
MNESNYSLKRGAERERAAADRQRLEGERDSAWQEAQREALEQSRLVGKLEALKAQVREQTYHQGHRRRQGEEEP